MTTRVGFVLECHRDGADHKVLKHVVPRLRGGTEALFRCCGSKRALFEECARWVEKLFEEERCERVFVVWDLVPCDDAFKLNGKPSRHKERTHLRRLLRPQDCGRTEMICITHELEAWLLADGKALTATLQKPTHPIKPIGDEKCPEDNPNPKALLRQLFKRNGRGDYNDMVHALKIIENVQNLSKLERAPSFRRLREKLEGLKP